MQVRGYEAEVRQLEALLQQKLSRDSRAQLLGQQAAVVGQDGASHRDRLLSSTQKLQSSSERIKQSRQVVADMEVSAVRLFSILTSERIMQSWQVVADMEVRSLQVLRTSQITSLTFLAGARCDHTAEPARPARDDTALAAEAARGRREHHCLAEDPAPHGALAAFLGHKTRWALLGYHGQG